MNEITEVPVIKESGADGKQVQGDVYELETSQNSSSSLSVGETFQQLTNDPNKNIAKQAALIASSYLGELQGQIASLERKLNNVEAENGRLREKELHLKVGNAVLTQKLNNTKNNVDNFALASIVCSVLIGVGGFLWAEHKAAAGVVFVVGALLGIGSWMMFKVSNGGES